MPYKHVEDRRRCKRESAQRARERKRARQEAIAAAFPPLPDDPAGAVAEWARERLIVPAGHPLAGGPMVLPEFGVDFLRDALAPGCREALLCVARKNAKSAIVAVLLLAHLCGPLRQAGWRAGVVSINKDKARELKDQIEAIALASGLTVRALRYSVETPAGRVEILSADKASGHAAGFDLAICDELGLLTERDRPLIAAMRSSTSAKAGRFLSLSIRGAGPFIPEILKRRGSPGLAVHLYEAPDGCALDDRDAWQAANPGLGTIKALDYMTGEAERVRITPWKWQAEKGPLRPREKGPPGLACQHINPASSERGGARVAHRREPAIPAATDSNREPAVPAGRRRSVASRETSWTAGTPSSRPGRKAHSCCLSGGTDGVSPAGP